MHGQNSVVTDRGIWKPSRMNIVRLGRVCMYHVTVISWTTGGLKSLPCRPKSLSTNQSYFPDKQILGNLKALTTTKITKLVVYVNDCNCIPIWDRLG
jgi:hypothetical protein